MVSIGDKVVIDYTGGRLNNGLGEMLKSKLGEGEYEVIEVNEVGEEYYDNYGNIDSGVMVKLKGVESELFLEEVEKVD